ncbi:MAG: EthD family reductase [Verrucomicrobia bacterium]|nr:EthD family reductase [Verrucomicrobiota bacterium]
MTKICILYPNSQGSRFDMRYYLDTHMPRSIQLLSAHRGFKGVSVERGLSGAEPGTNAAYIAMCLFLFDSIEDFMDAFMPHMADLQGDIPNYTDIKPVIQFNEVLISRSSQFGI